MASRQINPMNFPFFYSPPPSHPWSPPHLFSPPPPHHFTPPPPPPSGHPLSPPPPHRLTPPPPSHLMSPPPPPHHKFSPPPPYHHPPPHPTPPSPSPDHHPTVIVIVCISLGSVFLVACMAAFFCCIIKKKRKKMSRETEIIHFDEHRKIQETIIPGPHGETQAVVLTIEDNVHIDEEVKKNEKVGGIMHVHGTHKNLEVEDSSIAPHEHPQLEHRG